MSLAVLIGIVADTHLPRGEQRIPPACLERLRGADVIVHAGDLVAISVLDELEALGPPVAAVHGNVDDEDVRRRLPAARMVDAGAARIAVIHDGGPAAGRLARLHSRFPAADAVIFGHSHIPLHECDEAGSFQIFNPGSPTDRRHQPRYTMGLARVVDGALSFEHVVLD